MSAQERTAARAHGWYGPPNSRALLARRSQRPGRVATAPEPSPQGQLGAALLAMRKRSPKAPLSKLHDKMLGRST